MHLPFHWPHGGCDVLTLSSVREEQLALLHTRMDTNVMDVWITNKIEPNAVSWRKLFVVTDERIVSQVPFHSGSFFIDEEKKVLVVYQQPNKIAFMIQGNGYYEEVKLGRSDEGTLMCSYVPSSVQIQQVHAGRNRKRRTRSLRYFTK
ncbi:unnamed protein product [Microthlaspi erraticum]|uniref:F-box associated beta-propeller type 1 domain-containing protein n=1 Tax=Microthlaspi erraticum TaxID=1685480 RepID=A0A6D2JZ26_9BRAS|nr:unnamed protein product [Microthlaspi erraticum]